MNEMFMKFLTNLGGMGAKGNYNPSLKVTQSGGSATAAPWWARAAFAGNSKKVMKEGLLGIKDRKPSTSKYAAKFAAEQKALQDKALEQKFTTLDSDQLPGSFTNDRDRVAQKIAKASQNWNIPGLGQPNKPSKLDKKAKMDSYPIMKILERDKKLRQQQSQKASSRNAAQIAQRLRTKRTNPFQRPAR